MEITVHLKCCGMLSRIPYYIADDDDYDGISHFGNLISFLFGTAPVLEQKEKERSVLTSINRVFFSRCPGCMQYIWLFPNI